LHSLIAELQSTKDAGAEKEKELPNLEKGGFAYPNPAGKPNYFLAVKRSQPTEKGLFILSLP